MLSALDQQQLQRGIDEQTRAGKPFLIPSGVHSTGTLRLSSGAHIRFAPNAILRMLPQNADFVPIEALGFNPFADIETSRFEHALFFASDADGVTIEGPGRIECARNARGGPKPISLRRCRNVKLQEITIDQAPNYAISLIDCVKVDISHVKITRSWADGIDIDGSRNVTIRDTEVESFDDAICLKTSASLGRKIATRQILVENCRLKTASVFFKLGTESWGDFSGIRVRKLKLEGGMGNRHGNPGIALETVDGGTISNVVVEDVVMTNVGTPIFLRIGDRKRAPGSPSAGQMTGIRLSRIQASGTRFASVIAGLNDAPIRRLTLEDFNIEPVGERGTFEAKSKVPEARSAYPEPIQFGPIPASAFFFRHVSGLGLRNIEYLRPPASPSILLDNVTGSWPKCKAIGANRFDCSGAFGKRR